VLRSTLAAFLSLALLACGGTTGGAPQPPDASTTVAASPAATAHVETNEPKILSWGDVEKYYPEDAMDQGVDGLVRIAVTLDSAGRATDTSIVSETPSNLGFGAAASTLAHDMSYSNPTGRQAVLTFDVKFALPPKRIRPRRHAHRANEGR
jgi:TonB family protein